MDDLLNGPNWKIVEYFGYRNLWDIYPIESDLAGTDVGVLQGSHSFEFVQTIELLELDSMSSQCNDDGVKTIELDRDDDMTKGPGDADLSNEIELDEKIEEYVDDEPTIKHDKTVVNLMISLTVEDSSEDEY